MTEVTFSTNSPLYGEDNVTSYYDDHEYDMEIFTRSHPAIRIIYRIIIPIICACGILGIILTGRYRF